MIQEGVTQYQLDWHPEPPLDVQSIAKMNYWRTRFFDLGVIGQVPDRYQGVGFGNVSRRLRGSEFLITGTQTGALRSLMPEHFCRVLACDSTQNRVMARGPVPPSSEAMTHDMVYRLLPDVEYVYHLHAPNVWQRAHELGIPSTPVTVGYGTPAMAEAVRELIIQFKAQVVRMAGHEDGVIGWGRDPDQLGAMLVRLCRAADNTANNAPA